VQSGEEADGDCEGDFFFDVEVDAVEVVGLEEVAEGVVIFVELLFMSVAGCSTRLYSVFCGSLL
tara:strand:+ start:598 stop:789 length:192 start_codon:yes stop_codon:yes gene_type:complete